MLNKKELDCHPFVKWAGGKRQILNNLISSSLLEFNNYFEPFVGGGAFFFRLRKEGYKGKAFLFDSNSELINCYTVIRDSCNELIDELRSDFYANFKERYYQIRELQTNDVIKKAARFLYLNRTGYNGLYRVNSKGLFNVPFGKYKNPLICDENTLMFDSEALKNTEINCCDFAEILMVANRKDFVYFDPPYVPVSPTAYFTQYTSKGFNQTEQERLAEVFRKLNEMNCYVMLSNSDVDLVRKLYSQFNITNVQARRAINCLAKGRGCVSEVIIRNYIET
jgi:DNA adenine methylase